MVKLEKGKAYNFKIIKILEFPDNQNYYIFQDPFGDKHIVVAKFYTQYNLCIGTEVLGYIDKINCKGGIFIEPDHPYYKRGQIYDFEFIRKGSYISKEEKSINILILNDINGHECFVKANDWQMNPEYIPEILKCRVERIKKGRLILSTI